MLRKIYSLTLVKLSRGVTRVPEVSDTSRVWRVCSSEIRIPLLPPASSGRFRLHVALPSIQLLKLQQLESNPGNIQTQWVKRSIVSVIWTGKQQQIFHS